MASNTLLERCYETVCLFTTSFTLPASEMDTEVEMDQQDPDPRLEEFYRDIQRVGDKKDDIDGMFFIDSRFRVLLHDVNDESFEAIVDAIKGAPIETVLISDSGHENSDNPTHVPCVSERLQRIINTIGSLTTVTTVRVYRHFLGPSVPLGLIQSFRFVTKLDIFSYSHVDLDYEDLIAGITGHSSLQTVAFVLPTRSYRFILPVLRTIPHITEVCLLTDAHSPFDQVDKDVVTAFFLTDMPIAVRLCGFCTQTEELDQWLCDIIATTRMHNVSLYGCHFRDAASLR
jgi:hypothetical protein